MGKKVKQSQKIKPLCKSCFNPTHIKFNYSFITYQKGLNDQHKVALFDRMVELSNEPFVILRNRDKKIGLEYVPKDRVKIGKQVAATFDSNSDKSHRKKGDKYVVIRLYPNNNPKKSRIIGEIIKNVFYIFFIDIDGKLYKH